MFESKFDHLIPYVNKSKSFRIDSGKDPLICHRCLSAMPRGVTVANIYVVNQLLNLTLMEDNFL